MPQQRKRAGRSLWTRREYLKTLAAASAAASLPGTLLAAELEPSRRRRPRVAILATEVRKYSHAQHFIDRLLEGYGWQGRHHHSPLQLASLYVDQFPVGDLARERSRRHQVPIYPTIAEALTLGSSKLAVDGVLIIAEHGRYPRNEQGQTLYPRYRFFKETIQVFESSGRSVPVFNDKHLSTRWDESLEMVEKSRELGFAFLAGSSLPVTWRIPVLDIPLGAPLEESVCVCYGGVDSYDFHGLETAQCMSERRAGGEKGIESVQALKGDALWSALEARPETVELLLAALARSHRLKPAPGYTTVVPTFDWLRRSSSNPIGYFVQHAGGFQTAMFLLNGVVTDFTYAGRMTSGQILSCQMHLPMPPSETTLADFFNPLVNHIEQTVLSGRASYPVERTLLTSGMTLAAVESLFNNGSVVSTPQMGIAYTSTAESTFWKG